MSSNKKILLTIKDLRELGVIKKKKKSYKKRINKKTNKTLLFNNSIPTNNKNLPSYFQTTTLYNEQQQLTNKLLENKLTNGGNNRLLLNNGYDLEDNIGSNTSLQNQVKPHLSETNKYLTDQLEIVPDNKRAVLRPTKYNKTNKASIIDFLGDSEKDGTKENTKTKTTRTKTKAKTASFFDKSDNDT